MGSYTTPRERVLGTPTPLYTHLLVFFGSFTGGSQAPFVHMSLIINAVTDSLTCLLLLKLGNRLGSKRAGLGAALVWAIAPLSVTFATGGLETSLYVLLLTATVSAHLSEHHIMAAIFGALALLTRRDALILIVPIILDRLWKLKVTRRNSPSPLSPIL